MSQPSFLFLHPSDDVYGSDRVLLALVDAARRRGSDVCVLLPDDMAPGWLSGELRERGATVRVVPLAVARRRYLTPRGLVSFLRQLHLARRAVTAEMARFAPDIVHVNTTAIPVAAALGRPEGRRVVWHVHEIVVSPRPLAWMLRTLPMWAGNDVVGISDAVCANLNRARFTRARLHRVHNGVPARQLTNRHRQSAPLQCVFVGRLNKWKGYDLFVEAAGRVADAFPDVRFAIAGGPPAGEQWRVADLHRQLTERGLSRRVEVLGVCDDVPSLFDRSHVAVVPSRWPEPFGLVIIEAMRSGCAVVAADHGAAREIISDGETGVLFPPGDATGLASAMKRLLGDSEMRQQLGIKAASVVERDFSVAQFESEMWKVWDGDARE